MENPVTKVYTDRRGVVYSVSGENIIVQMPEPWGPEILHFVRSEDACVCTLCGRVARGIHKLMELIESGIYEELEEMWLTDSVFYHMNSDFHRYLREASYFYGNGLIFLTKKEADRMKRRCETSISHGQSHDPKLFKGYVPPLKRRTVQAFWSLRDDALDCASGEKKLTKEIEEQIREADFYLSGYPLYLPLPSGKYGKFLGLKGKEIP